MTRKTGSKYSILECGACGEPHYGYSGKLDKDDNEYVICGVTGKRCSVSDRTNWKPERERLFYPSDSSE